MSVVYLAKDIQATSVMVLPCAHCSQDFAVHGFDENMDGRVECPHCGGRAVLRFDTPWIEEENEYGYAFYWEVD